MITKTLSKALENIGFTYHNSNLQKSHAYALYDKYMVTVYEERGKKILYINFIFPENEENSLKKYDLSEQFSSNLETYSITDYDIAEDGMRITSTASTPIFLKLIEESVDLISQHNIKGVECCSNCGNKFGSRKPKKVTIGCENHIMCEHCTIEAVEDAQNAADERKSENNNDKVWKGILGSISFSVIGTLIYLILYYYISPAMAESGLNEIRYIFCICGFVVATLSYYGYRLFCKKASTCAYVIVSTTSILFTAIGQYIGVVLEFIAKSGIFTISNLSNKHFWLLHLRKTIPENPVNGVIDYSAIFWKLLLISIMFAAVGAAIFLLSLHDKSHAKPETLEVETISIK